MNYKRILSTVLSTVVILSVAMAADSAKESKKMDKSIYTFTMKNINGKETPLKEYKGKVLLVVNVASKCGFTPQYKQLEAVYKKYKGQGFEILGFPANNFGHQEPGTNEEIKQFCTSKFDVTFPMFAKISVKGDDIDPLYQYLTSKEDDPEFSGPITWNFNKFLIGKDGKILSRYDSKIKPDDPTITDAIETALKTDKK